MTLSPYPEFILPGKEFTIKNTGMDRASIDKVNRALSLPQSNPKLAVAVSRHELAHAKWSPDDHEHINVSFFQACEDARMNLGLQRLGIPFDYPPKAKKEYSEVSPDANPQTVLALAIATLGTNLEEVVRPPEELQYVLDNVKELLIASAEYAGTPEASIEDTEAAYEYILEQLDKGKEAAKKAARKQIETVKRGGFTISPAGKIQKKKKGVSPTDSPPPEEPEEDNYLEELEKEIEEAYARPPESPDVFKREAFRPPPPPKAKKLDSKDPLVLSGEMTIKELPMPEEGCKYRRNTYTPEGSVLVAPHRMFIDGAIFRRKKKHFLEGTVLIDVSGSMYLSQEMIEEIILASSGHTTVATYSGTSYTGTLQIVASKGKMAGHIPSTGGGNIVDYPALLWLGKQPGKKFMVCDGVFTGKKDYCYAEVTEGCKSLIKKHNVKRFHNMKEFMDFAKRLR